MFIDRNINHLTLVLTRLSSRLFVEYNNFLLAQSLLYSAQNVALLAAICLGWMANFPLKPNSLTRITSEINCSSFAKSKKGESIAGIWVSAAACMIWWRACKRTSQLIEQPASTAKSAAPKTRPLTGESVTIEFKCSNPLLFQSMPKVWCFFFLNWVLYE